MIHFFIQWHIMVIVALLSLGCSSLASLKSEFFIQDGLSEDNLDALIQKAKDIPKNSIDNKLIILDKVVHQLKRNGHRITEVYQISKLLRKPSENPIVELLFREGYQNIAPIEAYTLNHNKRVDANIQHHYPFAYLKKWPPRKEVALIRVHFQQVEAGSILVLRYQKHHYITELKPFLDGLVVLSYPLSVVKQKSVVIVPADMNLRYKLVNTHLEVNYVKKNGVKIYSIQQDWPKPLSKDNLSSIEDRVGKWMFSSIPESELSSQYQRIYQLLTSRMDEDTSSNVLSNIMDMDEANLVKSLYHFVSMQDNIINIPVPFGISGFIPQSMKRILEHKYAEAKDKTILLSKLLKKNHIRNQIALTDEIFNLDPTFPLLSRLNRPLLAIPNPNDTSRQWLDAYSVLVSYPHLPSALYGRWVLLLNSSGGEFVAIPKANADANIISYQIDSKLDEEANLDYSALISATGHYETQERINILKLRLKDPRKSFKENYRDQFEFLPHIQLKEAHSLDPLDLNQAFAYRVAFRLASSVFDNNPLSQSMISKKKPHKISLSADLYPHKLLTQMPSLAFQNEMLHRIHIHPSWKLTQYPEPMQISSSMLDYNSEYSLKESGILQFHRIIRLKVCPSKENIAEFMNYLKEIKAYEQQRIHLEKKMDSIN